MLKPICDYLSLILCIYPKWKNLHWTLWTSWLIWLRCFTAKRISMYKLLNAKRWLAPSSSHNRRSPPKYRHNQLGAANHIIFQVCSGVCVHAGKSHQKELQIWNTKLRAWSSTKIFQHLSSIKLGIRCINSRKLPRLASANGRNTLDHFGLTGRSPPGRWRNLHTKTRQKNANSLWYG